MPRDGLIPRRAMVLAAGRGTRLLPLTRELPKPLIPVAGRPVIDRLLDALAASGVVRVVVNLWYRADVLARHLTPRTRPELVLLREERLLDTGGGVLNALPHLGPRPFYVVNGDVLWRDGVHPALARLARAFDPRLMDALLLVYPAASARAYEGRGDFFMDQMGRLRRRREPEVAPFVFTGIQLLSPRLFRRPPAPNGLGRRPPDPDRSGVAAVAALGQLGRLQETLESPELDVRSEEDQTVPFLEPFFRNRVGHHLALRRRSTSLDGDHRQPVLAPDRHLRDALADP